MYDLKYLYKKKNQEILIKINYIFTPTNEEENNKNKTFLKEMA